MALLSIGLLTFAWTCARHIPWQIQGFSEVLFGCGMYLVWVTATVYIQDLYVSHSNSALAACSFVRYTIGAAAPMLSSLLRRKLGLPWVRTSTTPPFYPPPMSMLRNIMLTNEPSLSGNAWHTRPSAHWASRVLFSSRLICCCTSLEEKSEPGASLRFMIPILRMRMSLDCDDL